MGRLITAEFQKLATTRLWLWLLLLAVVLTGAYVFLTIQFADNPDNHQPPLSSPAGQRTALAVSSTPATAMIAVLAVIGMTGEFRHKTATATFLFTPRRWRVIAAKLVTYPLVGIGYAIACIAAAIAIALPWLSSKGIDVSLTGNGIPGALAGVIAAVALFGALGVALGALVRDQVAATVGLVVYLFIAETLIARIPGLENVSGYLPGIAERALSQVHQSNTHFLEPWQGGATLIVYAVVLAGAGWFCTARRDIT